ncbi:MAG: hypothetical protein J2O48_01340 [Solirubrobacterales bacterium]|nr:hypothetical protein [Solirubrobacterales bacterium]
MQYAMLVYPSSEEFALSDEERTKLTPEYLAFREDPRCVGGAALQPPEATTTVRHGGSGHLIVDGPYADTKEVLGGYFVFEAKDLDEAVEVAQRIPAVRLGGGVEIRPLAEVGAELAH